ncbi:hypothetical protein [Nocardia sp. NPDC057030]|uniref:hypothetical protein n=1 Tax=unclassified Nocardia TaxID=2637762 RepID=UPI00363430C0
MDESTAAPVKPLRVQVSGKTYYACLDPGGTAFYREHPDTPVPDLVTHGRGRRADFGELSGDVLWFLLEHLYSYAELFLGGGSDENTAREGRAIRQDWERLAVQCEPEAHGYYVDDFGHGWFHDARGWIQVRQLTGRPGDPVRDWVPYGSDYPRPWLDVAPYLPLRLVSAAHPDHTWRKAP